ncbi:MAG: VOC family protein [Nitrospirae bacterium]|nr:VOC family protein [Nitrospirota bacterium]
MKVDHVSFAVENLHEALAFFTKYLSAEVKTPPSPGYDGRFNFANLKIGPFKIEFLEDGGHDSFVKKFLDRRGAGFHHITLYVDDLEALVARLEADGIRVVDRWSAGGWKTAFIHPKHAFGILVQFWERPKQESA